MDQLIGTNVLFGFLLGTISLIVFSIVSFLTKDSFLAGAPLSHIMIALSVLPLLMINAYLVNIFLATREYKKFGLLSLYPRFTELFMVGLFFFTNILSIDWLLALRLFTWISYFGILFYLVWKRFGISFTNNWNIFKKLITFGAIKRVGSQFYYLNHRADFFIINYFLNPVQVGIYSVATSLSEKVEMLPTSMGQIVFADVSNMEEDSRHRTATIARNFLLLLVIAFVVFLVFGRILIRVLYGEEFLDATVPFAFLLIGTVLMGASSVLGSDLSGRGYAQEAIISGMPAFVLNIILNIILIPRFGIVGASIASMISYGVAGFIRLVLFIRITKIPMKDVLVVKRSDIKYYKRIYVWLRSHRFVVKVLGNGSH